jgi:enamine deaminase RidA (YjgF/YER057c/UK114 family)
VAEAKLLCPGNEEVLMLDAESVASEGQFDEALAMMDKIIAGADPSDTMSTIIKANILMQKVGAFIAHRTAHTTQYIAHIVLNS